MLGAGVIPAYFELWKRNGRVVGFSEFLPTEIIRCLADVITDWVFLAIDTLGGLFSLFALGKN